MGVNVFANGMEVSAKKSDNQSIAAMPDVCLSPPSPPAGPVPIPYPNFSQASDTSDGTKTVKLGGQEAGMKDESNYKASKGDEAATKTLGMGTVTHTIQGKTKFAAWSMDVKFEGANVPRFGDITTHNHANMADSACSGVSAASADNGTIVDPDCKDLEDKLSDAETNHTVSGSVPNNEVMATAKSSTSDKILHAASNDSFINPSKLAGYCERPWDPVDGQPTEPKVACSKDRFNSSRGGGGHAEGRVIQKVFAANPPGGSTLTLRIRWNNKGKTRQMPCKDCKGAICKAAIECGWNIQICVSDGKSIKKEKVPCKKNMTTGKPYWKKGAKSPLKGIL